MILNRIASSFIFILLLSCSRPQPTVQENNALDSLASQFLSRQAETLHFIQLRENIFPQYLYKGTHSDFADDSVFYSRILESIGQIDPTTLSRNQQLDYEMLGWLATHAVERTSFYDLIIPFTPYNSDFNAVHSLMRTLPLETTQQREAYLKLLQDYADRLDFYLEKAQMQFARGIVLPQKEIDLTVKFLKSFVAPVSTHVLAVGEARLNEIDREITSAFQTNVARIVDEQINPRFSNLISYLEGPYAKKTPDDVGLWQYPRGRDYYRYLVRYYTSYSYSPEEIHQLGLTQVELLQHKLDSVRISLQFPGDLNAFYEFLRTDKQFLADSASQVERLLKKHTARIEPHIQKIISVTPQAPYDIRRLPPALEPAMTYGYYASPSVTEPAGVYFFNGSKLDQRSQVNAAAVAFHEIIPGHHFQFSIQRENDSLSILRQKVSVGAFTEGWGDYAGHLATELGMYDDPYDYCGRLLMDMFISVRLVTDTGMNYFGWSQEKASAYMGNYLIESEEQINTETLRYCCDIPGQALAYKTGSLKLIEIRSSLAKKLGEDFNTIRYHDIILSSGSIPLSILERYLISEFLPGEQQASD